MSNFSRLYIHYPFCESRCHYCDFYALGANRTKAGDESNFRESLRRESEMVHSLLSPKIETIFFGGGTPSLTPPEDIAYALDPLQLRDRLVENYEWTTEANPSSIVFEGRVQKLKDLGINRVSLGVQSTNPQILSRLGRVHVEETVYRALDTLFATGISNVSADLMCGIPFQTMDDLGESIEKLTRYPIKHLSCYILTLAPNHAMYKDLPSEDIQLRHYEFVHDEMAKRGFEHYEISNFAKPGFRARHNEAYWMHESYLGMGPSAHSFSMQDRMRFKNISSLHLWGAKLLDGVRPIEQEETLTDDQLAFERVMLGLRRMDGVSFETIQKACPLSSQSMESLIKRLEKCQTDGLIYRDQNGVKADHVTGIGVGQTGGHVNSVRLTVKGFTLSDQIIKYLTFR